MKTPSYNRCIAILTVSVLLLFFVSEAFAGSTIRNGRRYRVRDDIDWSEEMAGYAIGCAVVVGVALIVLIWSRSTDFNGGGAKRWPERQILPTGDFDERLHGEKQGRRLSLTGVGFEYRF